MTNKKSKKVSTKRQQQLLQPVEGPSDVQQESGNPLPKRDTSKVIKKEQTKTNTKNESSKSPKKTKQQIAQVRKEPHYIRIPLICQIVFIGEVGACARASAKS